MLDNLQFPLFQADWTAKEELQLLQGVMKCGLGNWKGISELYVKSKTAEDCEEHYFTFYYKSKEDCMPKEEDVIAEKARNLVPSEIQPDYFAIKSVIDLELAKHAEDRLEGYRK